MIPYTLLPALYALALITVCAFAAIRERALWPVIAVMLLNWIGTRAITAYDAPGIAAGLLDLTSGLVLMFGVRRPTMVVLPVSALFGIMVGSYLMADFELLSRETMWAWVDVLGYVQLAIIAGGAVLGSGRLAHLGLSLRRVPAVVRSTSRRVQD